MIQTEKRKLDHIKICLEKDVSSAVRTGFEDVHLIHNAMPDINKKDIDTTVEFFGKNINAPIIIGAMTGGTGEAAKINKNLARAAEELGLAMGVGSQRAAIENEKLAGTYQVRDVAPTMPLIANLGLVQFVQDYTVKHARDAVSMIEADALAVHLNPAQEAVQQEGDVDWTDASSKLRVLCQELGMPVIVKETSAGISRETTMKLGKCGVSAIDISGVGGTSWSYVESFRSDSKSGKTFRDWGIPTAVSIVEAGKSVKIPLIASGGIRTGIDAAKALALGADYVSISLPLLEPATKSHKKVKEKLEQIMEELKIAMFLLNARTVSELKNKDVVITGKTKEWLELRGIKVNEFSNKIALDVLRSSFDDKLYSGN